MATKRKALPVEIRQIVLHEAGYKCAIPTCRHVLTLDIHHLVYVSDGGPDTPENLLPLCPNCHALHHAGHIPPASLRAWKMLLLTLNEAFDRNSVDILLALDKQGDIRRLSGDGILSVSSLVAANMVEVIEHGEPQGGGMSTMYLLRLNDKGRLFVDAWKRGDQSSAVGALSGAASAPTGALPSATV
jgi:hypothetical protein